jgi:hypothetical protein
MSDKIQNNTINKSHPPFLGVIYLFTKIIFMKQLVDTVF